MDSTSPSGWWPAACSSPAASSPVSDSVPQTGAHPAPAPASPHGHGILSASPCICAHRQFSRAPRTPSDLLSLNTFHTPTCSTRTLQPPLTHSPLPPFSHPDPLSPQPLLHTHPCLLSYTHPCLLSCIYPSFFSHTPRPVSSHTHSIPSFLTCAHSFRILH